MNHISSLIIIIVIWKSKINFCFMLQFKYISHYFEDNNVAKLQKKIYKLIKIYVS